MSKSLAGQTLAHCALFLSSFCKGECNFMARVPIRLATSAYGGMQRYVRALRAMLAAQPQKLVQGVQQPNRMLPLPQHRIRDRARPFR